MPSFHFKGKPFLKNYHHTVKFHNLEADKKKSLNASPSLDDNLIVHGDNLIALKALLPTHAGRVKCIYIDPPYNTGNEDWQYNDNVNSPMIQKWLGEKVGRDDLARHDKWCCMMYPRLTLLKDFLLEDGAIFISIDDNEINNLKMIMDEIFGEQNYIATISNVNNPKGRSDDKFIATAHEYVLIYGKNKEKLKLGGWEPEEKVIKRYNKKDSKGLTYREIDLRKTGEGDRKEDRPNMHYYFLYNEKTGGLKISKKSDVPTGLIQIKPIKKNGEDGRWRWGPNTANDNLNRLEAKYMPVRKQWTVIERDYFDVNEKIKPTSVWNMKDVNSERGTEQFMELGFKKEEFPKPKPLGTIKRILTMIAGPGDIVLDSFAGSGTTAHAVLSMNKEDGGERKFVLVECEDYADKITAERVRRVINGVPGKKQEQLKLGKEVTFSFYELGDPIEIKNLLEGKNLPSYENLAKYAFYTATGENLDTKKIDSKKYYVGASSSFELFLMYEPDKKKLKELALNLDFAEEIAKKYPKKPKLVFAPACFMEDFHLKEMNIRFAQLPFEIYRMAE